MPFERLCTSFNADYMKELSITISSRGFQYRCERFETLLSKEFQNLNFSGHVRWNMLHATCQQGTQWHEICKTTLKAY